MKATWVPRVGVIMMVLLLSATLAQAQSNELLVSHVQAALDPQTAKVDVSYRLETVDDGPVTVSLFLSTDSGATYPYLCETVSGDVGAGVLPGSSRHLVWDARVDRPGFSSTTCRLRVTADDGQVPDGFVAIPPGSFMMGSPTTESGRLLDETQHQVTLTQRIYVQTTEVTNQQYRDMAQWAYDHGYVTVTDYAIADNLDGSKQGLKSLGSGTEGLTFSAGVFSCIDPTHPVQGVTWYGSAAYCDWLSLQQGLPRAYNHITWQCSGGIPYTAPGYRLPTEAEWEYACRAGTQTPFNTGSCLDAGTEANYDGRDPDPGCPIGSYPGWTVPCSSYPANVFGLYDMHGNLFEWCNDWYGTYGGAVTDPVGVGAGSSRVIRGGSWNNLAWRCRSACRTSTRTYFSYNHLGFRPVRSADVGVPQLGTIIINPEPNSINAPWELTGPDGFSHSDSGDATLINMAVGSYTLTWGAELGWKTPELAAVTQTLVVGGVETFAGVYRKEGVFSAQVGSAENWSNLTNSKTLTLRYDASYLLDETVAPTITINEAIPPVNPGYTPSGASATFVWGTEGAHSFVTITLTIAAGQNGSGDIVTISGFRDLAGNVYSDVPPATWTLLDTSGPALYWNQIGMASTGNFMLMVTASELCNTTIAPSLAFSITPGAVYLMRAADVSGPSWSVVDGKSVAQYVVHAVGGASCVNNQITVTGIKDLLGNDQISAYTLTLVY